MAGSAGYSGTPLAKKLGIKERGVVWLAGAPETFEKTLGELPSGANLTRRAAGIARYDVIVLFVTCLAELKRGFAPAQKRLVENGGLWVAWPKKSSGVETDLGDGVVRAHGLERGLVDNKVCAIDATWSGLRFVVRMADRRGR